MFCSKCGYRISGGITVCPKCGNMIVQQGSGQNAFRNVDDQKFDRNEYINKYGDIPDMDGFGVDMGDDRMGETIELRFDSNNVGKASYEDLDTTSVIRAEDEPKADGYGAAGQNQAGAPISNHNIPAGAAGQNPSGYGAMGAAGQKAAGQNPAGRGASGNPVQGVSQGTSAAGATQNPLKQEIRYGEAVKKKGSKRAWMISGTLAALALAAAITVGIVIKNDAAGASDSKNAGNVQAWGEGFREKHILKHVDAVAATVNEPGMNEYWHCEYCGKDFSDMAGEQEVNTDDLVIYVFDKSLQGVTEYSDGKLYYVKNGVCDTSFNGFEKYKEDTYYFKNGVQDASFTGLNPEGEALCYIKDGKSDKTFNGFAEYKGEWFIVKEGVVDKTVTDVIEGEGIKGEKAWWYVKDGKITVTDTVAQNDKGWWYIKGGKVEFVDAIGQNEHGKWYCKGGKVEFGFDGDITIDGVTYTIKGGKVESEKAADGSGAGAAAQN